MSADLPTTGLRLRTLALAYALRERFFLLNEKRRLGRISAYYRPHADRAALIEALRRKVIVMSITAGRSGSTYLAELFAIVPGTTSLHEPPPHFKHFLRWTQHDAKYARRFLLDYKLPAIAAVPTPRYVEISHLLGKGFIEPLLELGVLPRIVMLRRHPRQVAVSWLARRIIPGRTNHGLKVHLHPGDPGVLAFPGWQAASDYQLCFWYALEMERRQRLYAELLDRRGGIHVDVTARELHDGGRFLQVAERLGVIDYDEHDRARLLERHREVSSILHKATKKSARVPAPVEEEEAVWKAVTPQAPWLRAEVERRYPPPPSGAS